MNSKITVETHLIGASRRSTQAHLSLSMYGDVVMLDVSEKCGELQVRGMHSAVHAVGHLLSVEYEKLVWNGWILCSW